MTNSDASIRTAADLAGVGAATLRAWEARYGFPRPLRLAGGHRRYRAEEIELIRRVREEHDAGLSVPAAIERVLQSTSRPASMFAAIRDALPDAVPQRLPTAALTAISHALEDECAWRAESAISSEASSTTSPVRGALDARAAGRVRRSRHRCEPGRAPGSGSGAAAGRAPPRHATPAVSRRADDAGRQPTRHRVSRRPAVRSWGRPGGQEDGLASPRRAVPCRETGT